MAPLARWKVFRFEAIACFGLSTIAIASPHVHAISIEYDYSYDSIGFFDSEARRDALEAAADQYETRLRDPLLSIVPGSGNTWTMGFLHPSGETDLVSVGDRCCAIVRKNVTVRNRRVPDDTLVVFPGAYDFGGRSAIAEAHPGYSLPSGTAEWTERVQQRGQQNTIGLGATDFAPWGGFMSFNSTEKGAVSLVTPSDAGFFAGITGFRQIDH